MKILAQNNNSRAAKTDYANSIKRTYRPISWLDQVMPLMNLAWGKWIDHGTLSLGDKVYRPVCEPYNNRVYAAKFLHKTIGNKSMRRLANEANMALGAPSRFIGDKVDPVADNANHLKKHKWSKPAIQRPNYERFIEDDAMSARILIEPTAPSEGMHISPVGAGVLQRKGPFIPDDSLDNLLRLKRELDEQETWISYFENLMSELTLYYEIDEDDKNYAYQLHHLNQIKLFSKFAATYLEDCCYLNVSENKPLASLPSNIFNKEGASRDKFNQAAMHTITLIAMICPNNKPIQPNLIDRPEEKLFKLLMRLNKHLEMEIVWVSAQREMQETINELLEDERVERRNRLNAWAEGVLRRGETFWSAIRGPIIEDEKK